MEERKEYKLADLCDELSDGLHKAPKFVENGEYIFVNAKNLSNGKILDVDKQKHITYEEYLKYKIDLNERTILYSIDGTIGNLAKYRNEKCVLGKGACYLNIKSDISSDYIYYQLQTPHFKRYINYFTTGSTIGHISLKTMRNYCFLLPPLPIQQKIAAILSSLDDKIELNNKINTNLEQQAQALFKNWSKKSSKSVKFTDLIDILGGGTPKTNNEDYWNGNIPFFTPKDVGNPYCLLTEKTITENGLDNCNSRLYPVNTIFVTARGTVGKVSLAGLPMAMNQSCYALKSKHDNQLLAYFYTLEAIDSLKHKATGATFDAIVKRDFETETINILSEQDTKEFTQIVKPIFEKILSNQKENINLSNLRETLLPKLMNGEIEV